MKFPGFVGPAYQLDAKTAAAQECINLYPEKIEAADRTDWILKGTPGLEYYASMPATPIRGMLQTDSYLMVAAGSTLYQRTTGGVNNSRGSIGTDAGNSPVGIYSNGNQLLVSSAGKAYYDNGGAGVVEITLTGATGTVDATPLIHMSLITWVSGVKFDSSMVGRRIVIGAFDCTVLSVPSDTTLFVNVDVVSGTDLDYSVPVPTGCLTAAYLGGYGIINPPDSANFYISRLYDFTSWDALDYGVKEGYADHIARVHAYGEHLYLLGYETTEVWAHTGNADFPFERVPGSFIPLGTAARWAVCSLSSGVGTIGRDSRGVMGAFIISGMRPVRVSTHAIEQEWKKFDITDATAYVYTESGHEFWVISFPTGNQTWVYDVSTGLWHRRATGTDRQLCTTYTYWLSQKLSLAGSRTTGVLYRMSEDYPTESGIPITRTRSAPHVAEDGRQFFHHSLHLDMQMGTIPSGTGQVVMNYSDDDGDTWSTDRTVSTGTTGSRKVRAIWRRLGRSRNRIYRVKIGDLQKVTIVGANLNVSPGSS